MTQKFDPKKDWAFHVYSGPYNLCEECIYNNDKIIRDSVLGFHCTHPKIQNLTLSSGLIIDMEIEKEGYVDLCIQDGCFCCPIKIECLGNSVDSLDKMLNLCFFREKKCEQ